MALSQQAVATFDPSGKKATLGTQCGWGAITAGSAADASQSLIVRSSLAEAIRRPSGL